MIGDGALGRISELLQTQRRFGKYELVRLVGRGGMGEVWLAQDLDLDRPVAIKFLNGTSGREIDRFRREAQQQAKLHHPSILPVYQVGECEGRPYIAMQAVDGVTLDRATLSFRELGEVFVEVCEAMAVAHEAGVIHRDLKPTNLMLQREPRRVYVMDFGIAHLESENRQTTTTGVLLGTPAFMSPEQARGETGRLDVRTDVYSLGATLYRLVTGRDPFQGKNPVQVAYNVVNCEPPLPRELCREIPQEFEAIVVKAMAKIPDLRYSSVREMAEDLRRFLRGEPVLARVYDTLDRWWIWIRRRRRALAVATVVSVATIGIVVAWVGRGRERELREKVQIQAKKETAIEEKVRTLLLEASRVIAAYETAVHLPPEESRLAAEYDALRRCDASLSELLKEDPPAAGPIHFERGRLLMRRGKLAEAFEELSEAIRLRGNEHFYLERSKVRMQQSLLACVERKGRAMPLGQWKKEIDKTRDGVLEDLKCAGKVPSLPEGKAMSGLFEELMGSLGPAYRSDLVKFKGLLLNIEGKRKEATDEWLRALEMRRSDPELLMIHVLVAYESAQLFLEALQPKEAMEALKIFESYVADLTALGSPEDARVAKILGVYWTTVAKGQKLLFQSPKDAHAKALAALRKALEIDGRDPVTLCWLAWAKIIPAICYGGPRPEHYSLLADALGDVERAIEVDPNCYEILSAASVILPMTVQVAVARNEDADLWFQRAEEWLKKLESIANHFGVAESMLLIRGQILLEKAKYLDRVGRHPQGVLAELIDIANRIKQAAVVPQAIRSHLLQEANRILSKWEY